MNIEGSFDLDKIKKSIEIYTSSNSTYLNRYIAAFKSNDEVICGFETFKQVVDRGILEIDSPVDGSSSKAVGSYCAIDQHFILMQSDTKHFWIVVQMTGFIDMVIYENKLVHFGSRFLAGLAAGKTEKALRFFEKLDQPKMRFSGFYIQHSRPFHFFYDQLKGIQYLYNNLDRSLLDQYQVYVKNSFIEQKLLPYLANSIDVQDINNAIHQDGFTLKPTIVAQTKVSALKNKWSRDAMKAMERAVNEVYVHSDIHHGNHDLALWIGVTGQKRSWLEQVSGYSNIIKKLSQYFSNMLVVVDGWTSTPETLDKDQKHIFQDEQVFFQIAAECSAHARFKSVIGMGYEDKINICQEVDFFIANAGTGSMVPLRFSMKDGVLHSNKAVYSFLDRYEEYGQLIKYVAKDDIGIPREDRGKFFDQASYHISWKLIFNLLVGIINERQGSDIAPLNFDLEDLSYLEEKENASPTIAHQQLLRLNSRRDKNAYIDCIKDIALVFQKQGMTAVALEMMSEAHKMRPSGKFIEAKVDELQKQINN